IEDEEASLETIRGQVKNAEDCCRSSLQVVESLISSGAPAEQTNRAWERNDKNKELLAKAKAEVNETVAILDQMKSDLQVLEAEEKAALEVLKKAGAEVKKAEAELDDLNNPLSLQNLKDSAIERGPRLVVIVAGCLLLLWVARIIERRLVRIIAMGRNSEGTFMEREARARTLAYVFRSFAKTTIIIGGLLMFLTEIGINIVPLLGGAAVFGLAVAFGAQSLIKDYFNGFMILLENQYAINDEIKIGDVVGVVERISLRMTMLRDGCGAAHFMPHGEIHKVTNLTHGWSRAVFDIGVAYKENIDDVMAVLVELSREMRQDPTFGPFIIDNVEMQGVENLADSAVVIRFRIKTRPLRQGPVRREMLRRIKNRFDELGIEIPFPYRTLVVRQETGSGNGGPRLLPEDRLTS
ncbi:MAG: mechanosensitive ion channel, partial [Phycisphaerae bacterium]|nr:mechanosensitive ion channel [Phycisphaerae bacterium]